MPHSDSYFGAGDVGRKSISAFAGALFTYAPTLLMRLMPVFLGFVSILARGAETHLSSNEGQLRKEQVHFLQCLVFVYDPTMWLSYQGNLYFMPRTDDQIEKLGQMKK